MDCGEFHLCSVRIILLEYGQPLGYNCTGEITWTQLLLLITRTGGPLRCVCVCPHYHYTSIKSGMGHSESLAASEWIDWYPGQLALTRTT